MPVALTATEEAKLFPKGSEIQQEDLKDHLGFSEHKNIFPARSADLWNSPPQELAMVLLNNSLPAKELFWNLGHFI